MTDTDGLAMLGERLRENVPLRPLTWFRVGGPARHLMLARGENDVRDALAAGRDGFLLPMGVASNMLVRDGGVDGLVIRFGGDLAKVVTDGETVTAGAGALDTHVARVAAEAGIAGLEFLSGVPGTLGGALRMNAGAYGRDQQISHAFLDSELTQLYAMARVIPPVFLFVSAFLVNMILSRLVALEREQVGLLKALGYSNWAIGAHYADRHRVGVANGPEAYRPAVVLCFSTVLIVPFVIRLTAHATRQVGNDVLSTAGISIQAEVGLRVVGNYLYGHLGPRRQLGLVKDVVSGKLALLGSHKTGILATPGPTEIRECGAVRQVAADPYLAIGNGGYPLR